MKIANKIINVVDSCKFLGVYIDAKLNWEKHLNYIRKKIAKGIGIIVKARNYLKSTSLLTLYYSFVFPYVNYGIEVWGSVPSTKLIPVLKLQKRVLRVISFSHPRTPSLPLFLKYKVLDVYKIYVYKTALFMFKFHKGDGPVFFQ